MPILVILISLVLLAVFFFTRRSQNRTSIKPAGPKLKLVTSTPPPQVEAFVSAAEFKDMVINTSHETPVLVDFYAEWCQPCHHFTPILSSLAEQYKGRFLLAKIDVDKNPSLAAEYEIRAMPTVMLFKRGTCVERFSGGKLPHSLKHILAMNEIMAP